jgi:hypothetical protein
VSFRIQKESAQEVMYGEISWFGVRGDFASLEYPADLEDREAAILRGHKSLLGAWGVGLFVGHVPFGDRFIGYGLPDIQCCESDSVHGCHG